MPPASLKNKARFDTASDVRDSLPFPLLGIDSDNGTELINNALLKWCQKEGIMFTRSRPYRKNDNCHVKQKNNSHVRNFVGYQRFSGAGELGALARVYRSLCPLLNYFIPTQKLLGKTRVGAKIYNSQTKIDFRDWWLAVCTLRRQPHHQPLSRRTDWGNLAPIREKQVQGRVPGFVGVHLTTKAVHRFVTCGIRR